MKLQDFWRMKLSGEKITALTCYDYWSAKLIESTQIDCILVGDSLAMVMLGYDTTIPATVDMMAHHVRAVAKGARTKFIVADLPFFSYRKGLENAMENVQTLMQCGVHAVKLEGAEGNLELIKHIVSSGVPVMGHLGLTPQSYHQLGGHKVQGRQIKMQKKMIQDALLLSQAGCFAIVLECIPSALAKTITKNVSVPTIGIGAGMDVDGQILVLHDLLGLNQSLELKFVKKYLNGADLLTEAIQNYHSDVKNHVFPTNEHAF